MNSVVQYGASLKSLMVYFLDYQLLASARVAELFADIFGCLLSEATLYTSRERCFETLEPIECLPSITLAHLEHQFSPPFCYKIQLQINGIR